MFQTDNSANLSHGLRSKRLATKADEYRRELLDQLFAERGGRDALDVVSRIAIENYAFVCAQRKTIEERLDSEGLFTKTGRRRSAFDMLKGIAETIDRLRAELPPPVAFTPPRQEDYSALSDHQLVERLETALAQLRPVDTPPVAPRPEPDLAHQQLEPQNGSASPVVGSRTHSMCSFGCGTRARCAELAATRPDLWRALHYTDPVEVARRDEEATRVMTRASGSDPYGAV